MEKQELVIEVGLKLPGRKFEKRFRKLKAVLLFAS